MRRAIQSETWMGRTLASTVKMETVKY